MEDADYDRDGGSERVKPSSYRRQVPRFGAFVTITAALLMLFGAASKFGNMPEPSALFGIDSKAERDASRDGDILKTAIIIGSVPVQREEIAPPPGVVNFDPRALPPSRGEFDIDNRFSGSGNGDGVPALSIPHQQGGNSDFFENYGRDEYIPPAPGYANYEPEPVVEPATPPRPESYVVVKGDTWVKVAARTLGDSNRWRDIMKINPASRNGLRIGMKLRIPQD